jgi:hypothetical protein
MRLAAIPIESVYRLKRSTEIFVLHCGKGPNDAVSGEMACMRAESRARQQRLREAFPLNDIWMYAARLTFSKGRAP